jgi:hypothetical protein
MLAPTADPVGPTACLDQPRSDGVELVASAGEYRNLGGGVTLESSAIVFATVAEAARSATWADSEAGAACNEAVLKMTVARALHYENFTVRFIPPEPGSPPEFKGVMEQRFSQRDAAGMPVSHVVRSLLLGLGRVNASLVISATGSSLPGSNESSWVSALLRRSHELTAGCKGSATSPCRSPSTPDPAVF